MATKTPSPTTPAANTSSGGRNIANCKARLCDPDRDVVSGTAREEDSAGSVYLLNKFMLDLSLYEEAITRYKARRFLLMNGYRLRKKASIPAIRLHDLRHGFASLLVSGGRSLYEVQQILGHSDPKVTMRYAHLSARALQDAANAASVIVRKPLVVAAEPEAKAA